MLYELGNTADDIHEFTGYPKQQIRRVISGLLERKQVDQKQHYRWKQIRQLRRPGRGGSPEKSVHKLMTEMEIAVLYAGALY